MAFVDTTPYTHDGAPVMKLLGDMALAASAALAQTPRGVPAETLLWHDQPVEDCCDICLVWVREWVPVIVGQFPQANNGGAIDVCKPIDMIPRVVVSLRRPCAPIPDAAGHVDHTAEAEMAEDLIVDARALMCGIFADWPPLLHALYPHARISYGSMTPTGASSGCLGWDLEVMLELFGCRGACGQ